MTDDKWQDALDRIQERFTIYEQGSEPLPEYPNGKCEFIVFQSPIGKVRLERVTKPRTVGERAVTSRRIGGATKVESQYDLHDMVHFVNATRWDEGASTWREVDASGFGA
ncbi:hypothetical protein HY634_01615 [Candidatus Uhrbacteria bacterium]|nr:hypothetical protein [Candidatus Uhrbacteria bacterium]